MNKNFVISVLGLLAGSFGAYHFLQRVKEEVSGGQPQEVLLLNRDLEAGDVLDEEALESAWIPEAYLDGRRVPARERTQLLGVPLVGRVRAGEGLYWSDVAGGESAAADLAALVPAGRRAFQLGSDANPFGTLIRVGDRVDVLCGRADETKTVLERVLVLAVGNQLRRDDEDEKKSSSRSTRGLSLSLLPEEAEVLLKSERVCNLRVVVRGTDDIALRKAPEKPKEIARVTAAKTLEIEHVQ